MERGEGEGEKKILFLFSLSPLPLTRPISSSLREVSTWRFREQTHLSDRRKRLPYKQGIFRWNDPKRRVQFTFKLDFTNFFVHGKPPKPQQ